MIRLRSLFERGRAHPLLGPILVIVLVLLLAMVFLHVLHDGHDAVTDVGAVCLALAAVVALPLLRRFRAWVSEVLSATRSDRGPPLADARASRPALVAVRSRNLPLRR